MCRNLRCTRHSSHEVARRLRSSSSIHLVLPRRMLQQANRAVDRAFGHAQLAGKQDVERCTQARDVIERDVVRIAYLLLGHRAFEIDLFTLHRASDLLLQDVAHRSASLLSIARMRSSIAVCSTVSSTSTMTAPIADAMTSP